MSAQVTEKTIRDLFTLNETEFCGKATAAISGTGALAGIQAAVLTELSYFPWQSWVTTVGSKAVDVLTNRLDDLLMSLLKFYDELLEYADEGKYPPGDVSMVPLVERTLKAECKPFLQIAYRELRTKVEFHVVLKLEIKSCVLKIEDARIKAIESGKLVGSGTISVGEIELVDQKLNPVEFPGVINFRDGIPIIPDPWRGARAAKTA